MRTAFEIAKLAFPVGDGPIINEKRRTLARVVREYAETIVRADRKAIGESINILTEVGYDNQVQMNEDVFENFELPEMP